MSSAPSAPRLVPAPQPEPPIERALRHVAGAVDALVEEVARRILDRLPALVEDVAGRVAERMRPPAEPPSPYISVEEACTQLKLKGSRQWQVRALRQRGKGKGWLKRDGRAVVVLRDGFLTYVRSLPDG